MNPLDAATTALDARLELDATTEAADAFNDEYEQETRALAARHKRETHLWFLPLKMWDATLDTRLCPRCASLAGSVRPWGVPFAERMPAHPRCRCRAASVLLLSPTTHRTTEEVLP